MENRAGATGTIGVDAVVKSPPDGYTLLFTADLPIVMAPALFKPPYDPKRDLVPVAAVSEGANMLVVHPSTGIHSLAELVAAAKGAPGRAHVRVGGQLIARSCLRRAAEDGRRHRPDPM